MPKVATPNQAEREFETGTDESFKNANATGGAAHNENQRVTYANIKRTYDVYQDLDIQAARQSLIEQTRLNQIASQALQNAPTWSGSRPSGTPMLRPMLCGPTSSTR